MSNLFIGTVLPIDRMLQELTLHCRFLIQEYRLGSWLLCMLYGNTRLNSINDLQLRSFYTFLQLVKNEVTSSMEPATVTELEVEDNVFQKS